MREISDYSAEFLSLLDELGLEPALIGGQAANLYRVDLRLTTDVDFLVRRLGDLVPVLEADGYRVKTMAEPGGEPYVAFVRGKGVQVDVLVAETRFQHEALDRAVDGVITVEDVIVHKLLAWRPRDIDDIRSILLAGQPFDEAYVERWAHEWDVTARWTQTRRSI